MPAAWPGKCRSVRPALARKVVWHPELGEPGPALPGWTTAIFSCAGHPMTTRVAPHNLRWCWPLGGGGPPPRNPRLDDGLSWTSLGGPLRPEVPWPTWGESRPLLDRTTRVTREDAGLVHMGRPTYC